MTVPPYPPGRGLLEGKIVLVTAAAGTGIGFSAAQRMVEEGATIVVSDRHERRLAETAEKLAALTGSADEAPLAIPCDVTNEAAVQRLIDGVVERHGRLDVLINNAGLGGTAEVHEMTDDQWAKVLDVTLTATFRVTRAALKVFYAQGSGVIVNNASVLGWRAQAGQAHYAAAKAGVMAFTRCVAMEAAPRGVRINAVAPSLAMHANLAKVTDDDLLATLTSREAFGRAAEPWEIATVMAFLASDYSTYLTGEVVSVSSQHA
ncbi:SDR family oxidoreductase [Pseudonocardia lutea]|uniref:SDR family oxidoreductase n=1 Tax=Pseudonocardia lutea TaxID=2172015 RepID=A0ABW1I9T4_9PSEU